MEWIDDLRSTPDVATSESGALLMGVMLARTLGRFWQPHPCKFSVSGRDYVRAR